MYFNYFKLILRRFVSKPLYPVISIIGLTLGFAATLLVVLWIKDELNYDQFHKNFNRTYRVTVEIENKETGFHWDFARSWYGWLKNMQQELPGVESMVRIGRIRKGIVKVEEHAWSEEVFYADPGLTEVFTMQFTEGDPTSCLSQPKQVILSESRAIKYFGRADAVNEIIYLYSNYSTEKIPYLITGVFKDFPPNSHVHFNILASRDNPDEDLGWAYYYILLKENADPGDLLANFKAFAGKYMNENELSTITPHLQKISDIHLHSNKDRELEKNGSLAQIKIISGLAIFVLFITLFNFFNLRYVFLLKDSKSLRIFRFAGAGKRVIFFYQFFESILYALLAGILCLILVWFIYPFFNTLMGKYANAGVSGFLQFSTTCLFTLILIATLFGLLPLLVLKTTEFLHAASKHSGVLIIHRKNDARFKILKALVSVQYIATFILIVALVVVQGQVKLFMESSLGNNKEKLISLTGIPVQVINKYQVFRDELLKNSLISDITCTMENPGDEVRDMTGFVTTGVEAETSRKLLYLSPVADNFFDFYDIPIIAGNNFPKFNGDDTAAESFILNEKAIEYLGWEPHEAVDKPFRITNQFASKKTGRIVGVVKNFQASTMKREIQPYIYVHKSYWLYSAQIRYDTSQTAESLAFIQNTWNKIYPDYPLEYTFVENQYKEIYKGEFQLRSMSMILCILALILSGIGLFGITGIAYESRTKEIGVRKVNGASTSKVMRWLLQDILIVVSFALVFAIPLSYLLTSNWLNTYVYHIFPAFWIYLLAGIVLIGFALLTVSWQTWRAANQNPVEALRYE